MLLSGNNHLTISEPLKGVIELKAINCIQIFDAKNINGMFLVYDFYFSTNNLHKMVIT